MDDPTPTGNKITTTIENIRLCKNYTEVTCASTMWSIWNGWNQYDPWAIWCVGNMMHDQYDAWPNMKLASNRLTCKKVTKQHPQYDTWYDVWWAISEGKYFHTCIFSFPSNILALPSSRSTIKGSMCDILLHVKYWFNFQYAVWHNMMYGDSFAPKRIWCMANMMHGDVFALKPFWCMT